MRKILKIFFKNWPIIFLVVIETVLFLVNYKPETFLVGWDNLLPELNFSENFKRGLFAVWQEYRGLGLLDGMAHAANLPHTLLLWLLHFILPLSFLRYFFVFLMHLLGGLGAFFLLKNRILKSQNFNREVSLVGALFYLFNLATIQMFYAPLEAFMVHFAFLPWLILYFFEYLDNPTKRNIVIFILVSIFSLQQGFIPQLFLVYILFVSLISLFYFFRERTAVFKKLIIIYLLIFAVNSFWALPYAFSTLSNSKTIIDAKINQMSSENVYLNNKARGNISDVILLKGFMLDVAEQGNEDSFYIMENWRTHTENSVFKFISAFLFFITLIGVLGNVAKRNRAVYPFLISALVAFSFLGSNIWGLNSINDFFRNELPTLGEAFRFSFTKFSLLFALCYSIFLSSGLNLILNIIKKYLRKDFFAMLMLVFLMTLIFIYSFPVFKGHFLFSSLKQTISQDYFEAFKFFERKDTNTRIASFPQPSFWSWRYHRDGYRGSGFLWYGIDQPLLDRAFDPWSDKNENYYWEISYALYSKNQELFEKVLEKYQINWLLVDGNVVNPSSPKALFFDELEEMISESNKFSLAQEFGKIKIYNVNLETPVKDFVFLAENLPIIGPDYQWNNYDQAYLENGNYLTNNQLPITNYQTYFPFRSLFTGRSQDDLEFEIEDRGEDFLFRKAIPESLKNYQLSIPEDGQQELIWIDPQDLSKVRFLKPEVKIKDNVIEVIVPKVGGYYGAEIDPTKELTVQKAINCQEYLGGQVANEIVEQGGQKYLRLFSLDAKNCGTAFWLPNLPHNLSYLITVESWNIEGKSLLFWLENNNSRRADLETYLPKSTSEVKSEDTSEVSYFIQPPMEKDGLGYTLHLDNLSIGRVETVNELGKITVNPIPFEFLTSLKLINPEASANSTELIEPSVVYHPNPSYYLIQPSAISHQPSAILVLSQAYHDGWLAWEGRPFIGKSLKHVLVNNWQNGWIIPNNLTINQSNNLTISILFWPQLLEYFGFILLGGTLIGVGIYCLRKK